jgi:enoyl-CoA hydratase
MQCPPDLRAGRPCSHMDVDQFALASLTEDHKEGVAAFLSRRKPRFKGR